MSLNRSNDSISVGEIHPIPPTCDGCCHFNSRHNFCTQFTIRHLHGKVYLERFPESPVCRTEYLPRPRAADSGWADRVNPYSRQDTQHDVPQHGVLEGG